MKREVDIPSFLGQSMEIGSFAPNFYKNPALYFYRKLNFKKPIMDQTPNNRITFKSNT